MVCQGTLFNRQKVLLTIWRYNVIKSIIAAVVATAFTGAAFAAAHTSAPSASATRAEVKAAGAADTATKDASGKTELNREGKMSPTGQNETSSVAAPKKDASSTAGAGAGANAGAKAKRDMGSADATTKDASGKTQANREGRMSPTGENATTSATPKQTGTSSK